MAMTQHGGVFCSAKNLVVELCFRSGGIYGSCFFRKRLEVEFLRTGEATHP